MKKSRLNNIIDFNFPITDDYLTLGHDEIMSIINNQIYNEQFFIHFYKYMDYLSNLTGVHNNGKYYTYMSIDINEKNNNLILTFSPLSLIISLANMLNCLNDKKSISFEQLEDKIKKLRNITSEKDFENNYPFLYQEVFLDGKKYALSTRAPYLIRDYEAYQKEPIKFNLFRARMQKQGIDIDNEYKKAKNYLDYKTFIKSITIHFQKILDQFENIKVWLRKNPIEIKSNSIDARKIYQYIIYKEMDNLYFYVEEDNKEAAQKAVMIIENLIKKYKSTYINDTTEITFDKLCDVDKNNNNSNKILSIKTNIKSIEEAFNKLLESYPYLKRNVQLPEVQKGMSYLDTKNFVHNYIHEILNETIKQNISIGAKELDNDFVNKQIKEIETDIDSGKLTSNELKIKQIILKKIKMVLLDIKPIAKQTGVGVFSSYYTYFYPNGMVAVDKLNGYGALYIMPVHVYKEVKNKKNLTEVRMVPGVKFVTHRSENWLDEAKNYILNGTENLTENDIKEVAYASTIEFPYTIEEMNNLEKSLKSKGMYSKTVKEETEKRKKRIKLLDIIDNELKSNDIKTPELTDKEFNQEIRYYSEEDIVSFEDLYAYWKKQHEGIKVKRNPIVALITKTRAKDNNGNYCCELCGAKSFDQADLDSHHMIPLSEGGVDNIYNTICLCPNCHRYAHSGKMTLSQKAQLFEIIRKHIEKDNPEYLSKLDKMLSPIAETEEYYEEHKEEIDENFSIEWNRQIRR